MPRESAIWSATHGPYLLTLARAPGPRRLFHGFVVEAATGEVLARFSDVDRGDLLDVLEAEAQLLLNAAASAALQVELEHLRARDRAPAAPAEVA